MKRRRVYINIVMAALVAAAVVLSPLQGQTVGAAPHADAVINVHVHFVLMPPATMCVGDAVMITFTYVITSAPIGGPGSSSFTTISATTTAIGQIYSATWNIDATMGSGKFSTGYKAKKAGTDTITFKVNSGDQTATARTPYQVSIKNCDRKLIVAAGLYKSTPTGDMDTLLSAKGGISISDSGTVTGGGSYKYYLGVNYTPENSDYVCDKYVTSTSYSTFSVTGTSEEDRVSIDIEFDPIDFKPLIAHCVDAKGFKYKITVLPGEEHLNPNKEINLGTLGFGPGVDNLNFPFGEGGYGSVYLIKTTGSGQ